MPYRPGDPDRDSTWAWIKTHHAHLHSGWEIVEGDTPGQWNKPRAVNGAVERSTGDVLIIADADVIPDPVALERATTEGTWVAPFDPVYRLHRSASQQVLESWPTHRLKDPADWIPEADLARRVYHGTPGGGVVVLPRETFDLVGGMDERFIGWGGEDVAFGWALGALAGPAVQYDAPLIHLWHRPQDKTGWMPDASQALNFRYRQADGDPTAMRGLIEEHLSCRSTAS